MQGMHRICQRGKDIDEHSRNKFRCHKWSEWTESYRRALRALNKTLGPLEAVQVIRGDSKKTHVHKDMDRDVYYLLGKSNHYDKHRYNERLLRLD